ncbi:hypothetical protein Tco_0386187 [Tanacetum coccineum]
MRRVLGMGLGHRDGSRRQDDNDIVDINDTMDILEDRISNLEMVFAYLKNKKMLKRKENKPNKDPRLESRKSSMDNSFTLGSNKEANHVKILQSYNGLLLCSGLGLSAFDYIYNPCTNIFKRLPQPEYLHDDSHFDVTVVLRMAYDPTKLLDYKVMQLFARTNSDLEIQVYSSETDNSSLRQERLIYYNFVYFSSAIYWNDAFHWLETEDRQLTLYKFNIDDHEHPIITTIEIRNGCIREGNSYSLLAVEKIIGLGEMEDDSFLVINLSEKVVKYNLVSKTISQIFNIGSNQMDDDYEFFPPYKDAHNPYDDITNIHNII